MSHDLRCYRLEQNTDEDWTHHECHQLLLQPADTQTGSSESAAHAQFSVSLLAQTKEEPASFVVQVFPPELTSALHETAAQTGAVQRGSGKLAHLTQTEATVILRLTVTPHLLELAPTC